MSGYIHTTRQCPVNQLHPSLWQAVQEYFQDHQLGDPEVEVRLCCETFARKETSSRLADFLDGNPDTMVYLGTFLTKDLLVWARSGDVSGMKVNGSKLQGMQVKTLITKRSNDMQLEIKGMIVGTRDYARGSLEMGPEIAAQKFCEEVEKAVASVTPAAKKGRLRWFGQ